MHLRHGLVVDVRQRGRSDRVTLGQPCRIRPFYSGSGILMQAVRWRISVPKERLREGCLKGVSGGRPGPSARERATFRS